MATDNMREAQYERATQLRDWHQQPPILILPNAWDAASARIFERAGARGIATTSSGVAAALGYPDGEVMSRDEMVAAVRRIVAAVTCPVTADIEAGYGESIEAKLDTIGRIVATGAVGINIEDSTEDASGTSMLVDLAQQTTLIQAIRAAATGWGVPLVINARVDTFLLDADDEAARVAETVQRGNAYLAAGADCVYPIGLSDATTIGDVTRAVHGPINILAGPHTPTIPELERLGVARVTFGGGLTRVALGATQRAALEVLGPGTFTTIAGEGLPGGEFRHLFGG